MPIYKHLRVLELARGIKAFLRLEVGLTRGEVPNPEQEVRQLKKRLQRMQRRLSTLQAGRGARTHRIAGDARDHFIGRVVRGKSFVDVGGLYDTVGEKVSVAHSFGASTLAMIDTFSKDDRLWQSFSDRMQYFGVSEFDTISEDISDSTSAPDHPRYDIVHCSGILHRMPDPIQFLSALHKITREYLVLGSVVVATGANIRGETLEVTSATSPSVPASLKREGEIPGDQQRSSIEDNAGDMTYEETPWRAADLASERWFPTVDSLKAMCTSVGFTYEDGAYYHDNAYVVLLSR